MRASIHHGDCMDVMARMVAEGVQVDSIVTDPPYHLTSIVERFGKPGSAPAKHGTDGLYARQSRGFMGKEWDGGDIAQRVDLWRLAYDLLKPGGHLLAFSSTRTQHRMVCAIEDAGFEVRDQIGWMYGSGFPKGESWTQAKADKGNSESAEMVAAGYEGWARGGLKPAWEPICVARKPLSEKNVAANVLAHGTGAINIDACRIPGAPWKAHSATGLGTVKFFSEGDNPVIHKEPHDAGRWPANVIHDGSDEVLEAFAQYSGKGENVARFFYSAKANAKDRAGSKHPTVKPISLMRHLCRLVTPPGGTVLDIFAGSGTTLQAAVEGGFGAIGIERESEYLGDILQRMAAMEPESVKTIPPQPDLFQPAA